jgi:hypothetical protein
MGGTFVDFPRNFMLTAKVLMGSPDAEESALVASADIAAAAAPAADAPIAAAAAAPPTSDAAGSSVPCPGN